MRLWRNLRVLVPATVLAVILLAVLGADFTAPYDPNQPGLGRPYAGPSPAHPMGLDNAGRDELSRLLYGGRASLTITLGAILMAGVTGVTAGLAGGYMGGWVDTVLMRISDVILCVPPIILAMAVVAFVGSRPGLLILVIGAVYAPRFSRVAYAAVQAVKHNDYVEAARALGSPVGRILRREVLPNVVAPILVQVSLGLGQALLLETGLSFVGLGPPPPNASWGRMVEEARRFMHLDSRLLIWPSLAISITVLCFNLLGDALRDALDPKLRQTTGASYRQAA